MLNAVLAGKKRGTGLHSQQMALESAEGAEDVLTASVFERLSYLSEDLLSLVLGDLLGEPFGPLQRIDYWPSWYLADGTRVEPDVLLQGSEYALLVEAKRYDNVRQQQATQLAKELLAGWQQKVLTAPCVLLTLGGLNDYSEAGRQRLLAELLALLPAGSAARFKLICVSWQQLYQALEAHLPPDSPPGCLRLLDDIARCYAWHGLRTHPMRWLGDLQPVALNTRPGAFATWSLT